EGIDQDLHAILRTHRASDRGDDGGENGGMRDRPPPDVAGEKRKGTIAVPTSVLHCGRNSPSRRDAPATEFVQRKNPPSGSSGTRPDGRSSHNGWKLPEGQRQASAPDHHVGKDAALGCSGSGRVSGNSSQTKATPQPATDARLKNAMLLPK